MSDQREEIKQRIKQYLEDGYPVLHINGMSVFEPDMIEAPVIYFQVLRWRWLPDWCRHIPLLTKRIVRKGDKVTIQYTYNADSDT
jgi:hypothetical protein